MTSSSSSSPVLVPKSILVTGPIVALAFTVNISRPTRTSRRFGCVGIWRKQKPQRNRYKTSRDDRMSSSALFLWMSLGSNPFAKLSWSVSPSTVSSWKSVDVQHGSAHRNSRAMHKYYPQCSQQMHPAQYDHGSRTKLPLSQAGFLLA